MPRITSNIWNTCAEETQGALVPIGSLDILGALMSSINQGLSKAPGNGIPLRFLKIMLRVMLVVMSNEGAQSHTRTTTIIFQ